MGRHRGRDEGNDLMLGVIGRAHDGVDDEASASGRVITCRL